LLITIYCISDIYFYIACKTLTIAHNYLVSKNILPIKIMSHKISLTEEELELYKVYIRGLADNNLSEQFKNAGCECASIVLSNIYRKAQKNINIYSKAMSASVTSSDEYLSELENFLNRDGKIRILLEETFDVNSKALEVIRKFGKNVNKVENAGILFRIPDNDGDMVPLHFTTADDTMFRSEFDVNGHKAFGSFNNIEETLVLNDLFNEAFETLSNNILPNV
jgi:hypothetical protein